MGFDKSKFIDQFKAETREHLQALNLGLLKLEKSPVDMELINGLMREAHSIKGAARMMGYRRIGDLTHRMEDGFQRVLRGELTLSKERFDVIFRCLDAVELLLQDKVTWEDHGVDRPFTEDLCRLLEQIFSPDWKGEVPDAPAAKAAVSKPEMESVPVESPKVRHEEAGPPSVQKIEQSQPLSDDVVRVNADKLNRLINLSGELLISKIRLEELTRTFVAKTGPKSGESHPMFGAMAQNLDAVTGQMDYLTENLQEEMLNIRMLPVGQLFHTFPRAMRDLANEKNKQIDFVITGQDTQMDKAILDEIRLPMMHLLRNAVDHGIESPEERVSKGKPAMGTITLSAGQEGSQAVITVADDGSGIDIEKVKEQAVKRGLIAPGHVQAMVDEQIFQLLFTPGFSTSTEVSEISGRGVGLDIVRETVIKLKGMVEVFSDPVRGTRFKIKLPLTLAITECLLAAAGSETYAIPVESVLETIRISMSEIKTVETKAVITVRGHIMPLLKLHDIFGLPARGIVEKKFFPVAVVQSAEKRIGILVDELLGRQKMIGKGLGDPLKRTRYIAGATILGSGRVVLILDVPSIINSAEGGVVRKVEMKPKMLAGKKKKTILVAEDVLTTAMLEKNILESVGYSVVIARDGREALEKAAQENFDMIISDVLMPRMDGFELITRLRKEKGYKEVPMMIVTTREADEDKRRGMEAGANAYLLKSDFTSEVLLETIERLLG